MQTRKPTMTPAEHDKAMDRIREVTGKRTQVELAKALGIRQSSISDAKRRRSIPGDWLLTLLEDYGVSPTWIKTGKGPRFLAPSEDGRSPSDLSAPLEVPELTLRRLRHGMDSLQREFQGIMDNFTGQCGARIEAGLAKAAEG